jgi:hypothetical protein
MVKSNTEILFIRRDYKNSMLTIEDLNQFDKGINIINPYCKYKFLLLNTKGDILNYPNLIHKMIEVNSMEHPKETNKNIDDIQVWKGVFKELNIEL